MADFHFEDYSASKAPRQRKHTAADSPRVTLQKKGTISLNHSARALLGPPDAKLYVRLHFDQAKKAIGISLTTPTHPDALIVGEQRNNGRTAFISGRGFFKRFQIDTTETRRYAVHVIEGPILIVDLNQAIDPTEARRGQHEKAI